jgi:hypothetical protein
MKFEKGQKVRLDLHTKIGCCSIYEKAHNSICIVTRVNHPSYEVRDGVYRWFVQAGMLKPLCEVQLLFGFMYED